MIKLRNITIYMERKLYNGTKTTLIIKPPIVDKHRVDNMTG